VYLGILSEDGIFLPRVLAASPYPQLHAFPGGLSPNK
jgi:hypothetical protein